MIKLAPCVIKSSQFGEVTAHFLGGNDLYCERKDGPKRLHTTRMKVNLSNLKAWVTIADHEWPVVPQQPEPTVTKELIYFTTWLVASPTDHAFQVYGKAGWKYVDQEEMCLKDFIWLLRNQKVQLSATLISRADEVYKSAYEAQMRIIRAEFVPMKVLPEMESKTVAALYTYHGDGKKLTQGLKALGLDVEVEQNYVTEGIIKGIVNLEDLIVPKEPRE